MGSDVDQSSGAVLSSSPSPTPLLSSPLITSFMFVNYDDE